MTCRYLLMERLDGEGRDPCISQNGIPRELAEISPLRFLARIIKIVMTGQRRYIALVGVEVPAAIK